MSGPFDEKYTDEQREAVALARVDGGRTAKRVQEMAAAGELTHRGQQLPPFDITLGSVYDVAKKLTRARRGETVSKVAELPHRDALEVLRRRLISAADALLTAYEKQLRSDAAKADPERLRQIMRCQLEASRLPGPSDTRPATKDTRDSNGRKGPQTAGGAAGTLLKDYRQSAPAQGKTHSTTHHGEQSAAQHSAVQTDEQQDDEPGTRTRIEAMA